ncbi:Xanthine dehydrogenase [Strongyloides ratti]|uniref:Xanthine dehydrogenase n=1 Tax=Strongyloides ratti TaxID=34506 RepID=A0A090MPB1_STRRB|nr:Xanthine dehydrogenase [Strongyloides ratti]CEF59936.1 Xanthine dehydrogenase [Strongyloides ratti]
MEYNTLIFFVNSKKIELTNVNITKTLADFLRNDLKLTGTKIGCNEGKCGSCTVMVSEIHPITNNIKHYSINACTTFICSLFGKAITTIEGITDIGKKRLHAVQERLYQAHGSQCGFCTPGFIMAMYTLLRNNPNPKIEDINDTIQGNLCRCTGYRPILETFYSFSTDYYNNTNTNCPLGENCCKNNKNENEIIIERKDLCTLFDFNNSLPYNDHQEPIFPPDLNVNNYHIKSFIMKNDNSIWFQPTTINQLKEIIKKFPNCQIVCGCTDTVIKKRFQFIELPIIVNIKQIDTFMKAYIDEKEEAFYIGSNLTLTDIDETLKKWINEIPSEKTKIIKSISEMIHNIGGKHIRNSATIGGNIAICSPSSDLNIILLAAEAKIEIMFNNEIRIIKIDETFFEQYKKLFIQNKAIIKGVWIPFSEKNLHFQAYKMSQRKDNDYAIINCAFSLVIENFIIKNVKICFGNVGLKIVMACKTMMMIKDKCFDDNCLYNASRSLVKEMNVYLNDVPRTKKFKLTLIVSLFNKFFMEVKNTYVTTSDTNMQKELRNFSPSQIYYSPPDSQKTSDSVGLTIPHVSGKKHTTGEAKYVDDYSISNCLHIALVLSQVSCGKINFVDPSKALKEKGVICYIDKNDIPSNTRIGFGDELIFAEDEIYSHGQVIGAIIGESHDIARKAASKVEIDIKPKKPIITIDDAIKYESFHNSDNLTFHSSYLENDKIIDFNYNNNDYLTVKGSVSVGSQEHMYLETNQVIVIPGEDDELDIISSTQGPSNVQQEVSNVLNIPRNKISVKVKRIGGGFGGKESPSYLLAVIASIAANKLKRPVKLVLERCDDMIMSGNRHSFKFIYKAAISKDKKLKSMDVKCFTNAGCYLEYSNLLVIRTMLTISSIYKWDNTDIYGYLCKTNISSNGAFRGFGAPQGMFCGEIILENLAEVHKIDINELRENNFYVEGNKTNYGMKLEKCNGLRCWKECLDMSNYNERLQNVKNFNKLNKFIKKGIYIVPTMFPVGFGLKTISQAASLINIYSDGSILVSHGGMEMGQGLHTKIIQIVSRCLEVPIDKITIRETRTDNVPNTTPTVASLGIDLNGGAVKNACEKIMKLLEPIKENNKNGKWEDWIKKAYESRIPLSATGYSIIETEDIDFTNKNIANSYSYCVYGAACSEIELDCLTGAHKILRSDIVMDIGDSINPAIDIGQIEGGFIQGYGYFTMEEVKFNDNGIRMSKNCSTYRIPTSNDIPKEFNVKLLKGSSNKKGIFSSKAVGEPPLFLGSSVFFAIKEAIKSYRKDNNNFDFFNMNAPATCENIRSLCIDSITGIVESSLSDGENM